MTSDGFIVVDPEGVVMDISLEYAKFLKTTKEEAVGHSILKIIPNSRMLDVVKNRFQDDEAVHEYVKGTSKEEKVIVSRRYVEDDKGNIIAGVAHVKFRIQSLDVAKRLTEEYSQLKYYKEQYNIIKQRHTGFNDMIGSSPAFVAQKKEGMKIAKTNFSVLITGETGTGKELFANGIHNNSDRADMPMVSINCAAIPGELLESELFGYADGAFTGAKKGGKKGKFELANRGTIFLDEIGDMPLWMQAKILRVLQEREVEPIGGVEPIPIDIRVISATRQDLAKMVREGNFREDLYYRLNVVNVEMIPLRHRKSDIIELAEVFLERLNQEYKTRRRLSSGVKRSFREYYWPGNIRELDNVIKSAYASSGGSEIQLNDLPNKIVHGGISVMEQENVRLKERVNAYERQLLLELMGRHHWNFKSAAEEAGIHRSLLYKKIDKYDLKKARGLPSDM